MEALGGRLAGTLMIVAAVILAVSAAFVIWLLLVRDTGSSWPATVPALSADDLTKEPTDVWLTNGGTLANQRFSSLDEIDTSNVGRLKGVWMTHLESGTAAKYSAEGQPIFYNDVLYVPTGEDDVFAVDVETGKILWKYESGISQKINTVCCGWLSRGVAIGERSTSASSTATSSRSTRTRAPSPGRRRSGAGGRDTRSPRPPSTTTGW